MIVGRRGLHTKLTLAAGVAFLAFAHVRADMGAEAPLEEEIDAAGEMAGDIVDPDAPAPEEEAAAGDAEVPPPSIDNVPVTAELDALSPMYVAHADTEYQPSMAPPEGTPVVDVQALSVPTATACAEACIASAECNAATWMGGNPEWVADGNCYLKTLGQPCERPEFAETVPNVFLLVEQTEGCQPVTGLPANTGAMGPMAAGMMPMGAGPAGVAEPPMMGAVAPPPVGGVVAPPVDPTDPPVEGPIAPAPPPPVTGTAPPPLVGAGEAGSTGTRALAPPDSGVAGSLAGVACAVAGVAAGALLL